MTTIDLSDPRVPSRRLIAFLGWTALALAYAAILHLQLDLPFLSALFSSMNYFYTLALLAIPVRRLSAWLFRVTRPLWQHVAVHFPLGVVVVAAWQALHALFHRLVLGSDFWVLVYRDSWLFQLLSASVIYVAMIALMIATMAFARDQTRVRREHELAVAARDAQLAVLKAQFQPHFVLNALNSLLALIDKDPALARTMVVRLADLMRAVFDREDDRMVPLERELDLVCAYLDIERMRLGSRLSVTFHVHDAARGVLVPRFLLQPVVENAVQHGVAPFARPGFIEVSATITGPHLRVVVRDSGSGPRAAAYPAGTGRGLQITRSQLDGAYGDGYRMTFLPGLPGTAVEIEIPVERPGAA